MIRNAGVTLLVFWSLCWCSSAADDDGDDLVGLVQRNNGARTARTLGTYDTTLAFTIPLFSFTLPERQDLVENKDYTKQAALSLLGLGLVGGLAVIPYIFAAVGRAGADSAEGRDDSSSAISMVNQLASLTGLNHQECVSRSICEIYRKPERYGILVLPLRYFLKEKKQRHDGEPTAYERAADFGTSTSDECDRRYRCSISIIGAMDFLFTYAFPSSY